MSEEIIAEATVENVSKHSQQEAERHISSAALRVVNGDMGVSKDISPLSREYEGNQPPDFDFSSSRGVSEIIKHLTDDHAKRRGYGVIAPRQFLREYTSEINNCHSLADTRLYIESIPYVKDIVAYRNSLQENGKSNQAEGNEVIDRTSSEVDLFLSIMQLPFIVQQKMLGKKEGLTPYFTQFQVHLYHYIETHDGVGMNEFARMLQEFDFGGGVKDELDGAIGGAAGEVAVNDALQSTFRRATVEEDRQGDDFMRLDESEGYFDSINVKCPRRMEKLSLAREDRRLYVYVPRSLIQDTWRLSPETSAKLTHFIGHVQTMPHVDIMQRIAEVRH